MSFIDFGDRCFDKIAEVDHFESGGNVGQCDDVMFGLGGRSVASRPLLDPEIGWSFIGWGDLPVRLLVDFTKPPNRFSEGESRE